MGTVTLPGEPRYTVFKIYFKVIAPLSVSLRELLEAWGGRPSLGEGKALELVCFHHFDFS